MHKNEKGVVMPLFAMTAVCFLLILFLIVDIGAVRIVQGDLYKSLDAGALAGAAQSSHHEFYEYEQQAERIPIIRREEVFNQECVNTPAGRECRRVPPYYREVLVGWQYRLHEEQGSLVADWVEIERDAAYRVAQDVFWRNAQEMGLNEGDNRVLWVEPEQKELDVLQMEGEVRVLHRYLPSFVQGFFGETVPHSVNVHKSVDAKAVLRE
ncbi:hypothetical protein GCM10010965_29760 [Caldalkalibacillus thermarum]|uniref:TadE/TadG family type IV pilus assembly protein n=1 Tax=Caldalkalibacillus thermarum TaxID=296745 RepID=UPI00166F124E|nr:pilus assembly protein TadG-related protein [Caldalkalibacillus thermarum]GGK34857.1 hypothetical protein GCM10010965_29760 [Caldalkalibacillus thermarum]